MKFITRNKMKMNRITAVLLVIMLLGLSACGGESATSSASDGESVVQENVTEPTNDGVDSDNASSSNYAVDELVSLTLADAKAELICKNEWCIALAYYGPENVRLSPCWEGTVDVWPFGQYDRDLSSGWKVAYTIRNSERGDEPFSEEALEGLGLEVKDRTDESSSVILENLEQMSEAEMRAIGIPFLDGHICLIGTQTSVGNNNFRMIIEFSWLDEMSEADSEGFLERVSFFAGNGAPLDDYFDGYTLKSTLDTNITFTISLDFCSSDSDKEQNKTMIQELKTSEPYMIYTGLDGETVKTSLSLE